MTASLASIADCRTWLDRVEKARQTRTTGAWPPGTVLDHLAQSVEMSMDGYPQPRGALFQSTAGRAAFEVFRWRGRMNHGLAEPIPGAPPLAVGADWQVPAQRLRAALARFDAYNGPLRPHFAYGALTKPEYAIAHAMHVGNHAEEFVLG